MKCTARKNLLADKVQQGGVDMKLVVFTAGVFGLLIALGGCSAGANESGAGGNDPSSADRIETGSDDQVVAIALETCVSRFIDDGYKEVGDGTLEGDWGFGSDRTDQVADFTLQTMESQKLSAADERNGIAAKFRVNFDYFVRYRFGSEDWAPWQERGVSGVVTELADGDYDAVCWL